MDRNKECGIEPTFNGQKYRDLGLVCVQYFCIAKRNTVTSSVWPLSFFL